MSPFRQPAAGDRLSFIPVLYLSACVITHYTSFQFNLFSPSFQSRVERLLVVSMYHCDLAEAHARFTQLRSNSELVSDSFLWNLWILFPPGNVCVSGQKYSKYFSYGVMLKPLHSLSDFPPRKVGNQIPCGRWRPRYEPEPRWVVFAAGSGIFPRQSDPIGP